jgi:hypothetical protein
MVSLVFGIDNPLVVRRATWSIDAHCSAIYEAYTGVYRCTGFTQSRTKLEQALVIALQKHPPVQLNTGVPNVEDCVNGS